MSQSLRAFVLAATLGLPLWSATSWVGTRPEPWDNPLFWSVAYPISLLASLGLGILFPDRPWRWAAVLIFAQLPIVLLSGSDLSLLPLGLVGLAGLTVPAAFVATIGAGGRRWIAR
ncbi:hypothetical protein ACM61V_18445 [Sphingomonas sp. TX0543]|uniref:Uncharacterized protein n=1 Tax=Edaphosphingomonas fennica TaxID=114404 RepID=A0A2T4I4V9_9SPHN|nr:hypothetical protein [Sphingomonas fennica]PTD24789.1 hypothetical protein CV103_07190 [Sphingomonas fennica]